MDSDGGSVVSWTRGRTARGCGEYRFEDPRTESFFAATALTYLGDAVGKWQGDTLVIESVKFVDDTWLTDDGSFHSPSLKVTEKLRLNGEKLEYQAIADDPAVLAEPWQLRPRTLKRGDKPINEPLPCIEQDLDHVVDGTNHDNAR